jgi:hypothetical protein
MENMLTFDGDNEGLLAEDFDANRACYILIHIISKNNTIFNSILSLEANNSGIINFL